MPAVWFALGASVSPAEPQGTPLGPIGALIPHDNWCRWISNLNSSSQSVILLNGKPGPWIKYCGGLHQGDPLSLFISIIVADVLRGVFLEASSYNLLSHPLDDSLTCPVTQFADDTLIVLKACQESDTSNLSYLGSPKQPVSILTLTRVALFLYRFTMTWPYLWRLVKAARFHLFLKNTWGWLCQPPNLRSRPSTL